MGGQPHQRANGNEPDWPEALVAELVHLRRSGLSASQISAKIGKSRCAVLGKLDRLRRAEIRAAAAVRAAPLSVKEREARLALRSFGSPMQEAL